jgi:hypothetical protein
MDRLVFCGPGTARGGPVHWCYFAAVSGCFRAGTRSAVACDASTRHVIGVFPSGHAQCCRVSRLYAPC